MLNLMHLTAINILRMRCFKKDITGPNPYVYIPFSGKFTYSVLYSLYKICNSK